MFPTSPTLLFDKTSFKQLPGEEEGDWVEAVVEQLRVAKKTAMKITKAKARKEEEEAKRKSGKLVVLAENVAIWGDAAIADGDDEAAAEQEVPEWILQQLPGLLKLLESCRLLVHVRCGT